MLLKTNFKRVLLKLSGEVLSGNLDYGIDPKSTQRISKTIKKLHSKNIQVGIVIGGALGYFGGRVDLFGLRLIEIFSAMPFLFLMLHFPILSLYI